MAAQLHQRRLDLERFVADDGIAVRRLIARAEQRVERERIAVGNRPLLLDEGAEDADLFWAQRVHAANLRGGLAPNGLLLRREEPDRAALVGQLGELSGEPV